MAHTEPQVIVVGAGAAGLAAAAALRRACVDALVLEAAGRVGDSWARRYDRLHLHTVRRFSALPYRPLPRRLPRYVAKDEYASYLDQYARSERLDVRVGHEVRGIEPTDGRWLVRTAGDALEAQAVVVATGKHRVPWIPEWPGREEFGGRLLHSADYRAGAEFAGARALVVGIGNSGAEIATDLVEEGAAFVAIAVRSPPPIVRRQVAGVPAQLLGMAFARLPARGVDRVAAAVRRVAIGDLSSYGIGPAAWGTFERRRPPVIDVGFIDTLKARRIVVHPAVTRLTPAGVEFSDGREEPFEVVIAATGFRTGLAELLTPRGVLDEDDLPRAAADGSSACPGLFFVGFRESPRGVLYEIGRDARLLARAVARHLAEREPEPGLTRPGSP
jgi:putative flavoprotein involved in K+ transport